MVFALFDFNCLANSNSRWVRPHSLEQIYTNNISTRPTHTSIGSADSPFEYTPITYQPGPHTRR
jgi:hypothetical protein